jgi:hypothetical protein
VTVDWVRLASDVGACYSPGASTTFPPVRQRVSRRAQTHCASFERIADSRRRDPSRNRPFATTRLAAAFFATFAVFLAAAFFIVSTATVFIPLTAQSGARRHGRQAAPEEVREPPEHAGARREAPRLRAISHREVGDERIAEGDGEAGVGPTP